MDKVRIYYISASESATTLMKNYISKTPQFFLQESSYSINKAKQDIQNTFPDIIIIDESVQDSLNLTNDIKDILLTSPFLGVIVLTSEISTKKMREVMNVGARDVITKPFSAEQLRNSILSIHQSNDLLKKQIIEKSSKILTRSPKMITVFSTKGGVGKSVISSLLTTGLSYKFKEDASLVDLDLQFGDLSLLLDLKPKQTLTNAVENIDQQDNFSIRSYTTKHDLGMNILAAPLNPEEEEFITESSLTKVFRALREEYDYTVIDTPPGFTDQTILALEQSDLIFFVTSPEISALKNTKNGLETLKQLGIDPKKIRLIVNRFNMKSNIKISLIEEIMNCEVFLPISNDYERVIQFLNQGQPEIIYGSKSKIAKDFYKLINGIRAYHTIDLNGGKPNLFKRLFQFFKGGYKR